MPKSYNRCYSCDVIWQ